MTYFFADGEVQKGPFPLEVLRSEGLKPDSLVWREGMAGWQRANTMEELASVMGAQLTSAPADAQVARHMPGQVDATPLAPNYQPATYPAADAPLYPPAGSMGLSYQQAGYYGGATPPTGMAVASMVLGIIALPMTCFYGIGTPCAIIAIILGHIARGRARRGESGGAGMALAGMICGYVSVGMLALTIIAVIIAFSAGAFR